MNASHMPHLSIWQWCHCCEL